MAKSDDDSIVFECGYCHTKVQGTVKGRHSFRLHEEDQAEEWVLGVCSNCRHPNLIGREYYGSWGDEEQWGDWRIFPPRARTFGQEVPESIRETYNEAQVVLRAQSFMATALMCRRAVELLAKDKGAKAFRLDQKLKELLDSGVIDSRLHEWAEALRLAGNDAAHEDDPTHEITKEDADDLMTFTEAMIDYVYIYRARFDEFTARRPPRAKRSGAKETP